MKSTIKVAGVMLALMSPVASAQKDRTDREQADRIRAVAKIVNVVMGSVSGARLAVDAENERYLAVTVTDRQAEEMTLEFEPNETSDVLRPILPEGTEPEIFGQEYFGFGPAFLFSLAIAGNQTPKATPKEELLPFEAAVARQPHDDVSVFVVDEELVLIRLWDRGRLLGTYYAVDVDAAVRRLEAEQAEGAQTGEDFGGVAATPGGDAVCRKLGEWCTSNRYDMPTVIACIAWLVFCDTA